MQFISTAEAAKRLGVNERHVRWLIEKKKLTAQRVGRAHLVEVKALASWKRSNRGVRKAKAECRQETP